MAAFDAVKIDPARIALGTSDQAQLQAAAADPSPESPACQAALAEHRQAQMFEAGFTGLVLIVATATAIALVVFIVRIAVDGFDAGTALAAVTTVVTGGASVWLTRKWQQARAVAKDALADVGKYCGQATLNQVK